MRIAHLLPYTARFPLAKHNGRYEWVLRLAKLQVKAGHTVTIYAAPGSTDDTREIIWKSQPEDFGDKLQNNKALLRAAFKDISQDIFHSHFDNLHYEVADTTDKPVVFTQHWFPDEKMAQVVSQNKEHNVLAIAPTQFMAMENNRLGIPTAAVIPHGIDLGLFKPIGSPAKDRLLFVGRITKNKGVKEAIELALFAQVPIDIVGKINQVDREYWRQIEPLVDNELVRFLGPLEQVQVASLMANAKAFIFPMQAAEAFGQVIIEAQACGTPVIIGNLGASNELVANGKSGFIATTKEEFLQAIQNIDTIDRSYCRQFAEAFDIHIMVDRYDELYARLISSH